MVQQDSGTMGEERSSTCAEKKNYEIISHCRHRHSSVISSCSEDAESESTSGGYPSIRDEKEEEFEYGPGIVSKLKTRYLSIALKQNRGTNMRRSCSMENLLDQDRSPKVNGIDMRISVNGVGNGDRIVTAVGNLKRAKSMDTLLMDLNSDLLNGGEDKKQPKIIRKVDGGLNRTIPMICDEELPKPDTVKTYKRMFEPAESRRGSYCRRPPVLRASAKSSALAASKSNGVLSNQSAKVNGTSLKSRISAKQQPAVKAQSNGTAVNGINGSLKKPCVKDLTRPAYNGCHVVKASPIKLVSSPRENKDIEREMNNINRFISNSVASKPNVIPNGNMKHKENSKIIQDKITNHANGVVKPKVPPNKPSLKLPKPLPKVHLENGFKEAPSKVKTSSINGYIKSPEPPKIENNHAQVSKLKVESIIEEKIVEEPNPPEVSKIKNGLDCKQTNGVVTENASKVKNGLECKQINEVVVENALKVKNGLDYKQTNCVAENALKVKSGLECKQTNEVVVENALKVKNGLDYKQNNCDAENALKVKNGLDCKQTNGIVVEEALKHKKRLDCKQVNGIVAEKTLSPTRDIPKLEQPIQEKNPGSVQALPDIQKVPSAKPEPVDTPVKLEPKPVKKLTPSPSSTSMVFDFRGRDVVPHVAVLPTPFGCKSLHPKKRPVLIDGKPSPNSDAIEDEDEDYVDYSVPPPSGVIFEGENIKIGRGSILSTRNKELKITFDEDVDGNTFVYPSESSMLEDSEPSAVDEVIPNDQPPPTPPKLKTNTVIGTSGSGSGLSAYTPSVLRTMDNFEPGMYRPPPSPVLPDKEDEKRKERQEEENNKIQTDEEDNSEMLKPADPDIISSWSLSAGTSDLLF